MSISEAACFASLKGGWEAECYRTWGTVIEIIKR